jgi:hypothetical protein
MKKIILLGTVLLLVLGSFVLSFCSSPNENYLQVAKETTAPNFNFLFAKNASLLGRIGMTLTGKRHKTCINTVTSFFNEYHTCSNCEDFVANPEKWNFERTEKPEVGDIIIQHDPQTGRAYHAALIVNIENGRYYVNHAIKTKYIKNVELKNKTKLTFYRFISN